MGSTLRRWKQLVFHHEASPGVVLMAFAALALVLDNSSLSRLYEALLDNADHVSQIGALEIDKPLLLWINDGLMAIFFFLVGLEIKRELVEGELSSWNQASLPAIAALGGMLVPALIYVAFNCGRPGGCAAGRSRRRPTSPSRSACWRCSAAACRAALKVFLLALAIIDDLGAIVIIALFYTADLSLGLAGPRRGSAPSCLLVLLNLRGVHAHRALHPASAS